ncbi:DNA repair protein [Candidatus Gracilibacteria bacterium]|nr:DNA repair protein [Candidatus Gracilibacteria bacterium]
MGKINEIYEVEVTYKRPVLSSMKKVISCEDAIIIFKDLITEGKMDLKEFFLLALLTRNHHVLGVAVLSVGNTNCTTISTREVLQLAIKTNSSAIIMCHNHPSGNLEPSQNDIEITRRIKDLCELCDIALLDHIIITSEGHSSFIERV